MLNSAQENKKIIHFKTSETANLRHFYAIMVEVINIRERRRQG